MKNLPRLVPSKYDLLVVAAVLLTAALVGVRFWGGTGGGEALSAVVTIDAQEIDRFPLAAADGERTYTNNGVTLYVAVCAEGVRVERADCPTQDCVHTGQIDKAGQSIVCLPAHIVITLVGGADTGYDVIVG